MKQLVVLSIVLLQALVTPGLMASETEFPGRAKYPEIPVLSKEALLKQVADVVIVDTRSSLEYETLRIKGANNIPVASKSFEEQVKALRATTNKPIVFYCNGRTCYKSYLAATKALKVNVKDVYAYDAGMFEWAKAYPEQAVLLGKSPINAKQIISANEFKERLLDPNAFSDEIYVRDRSSVVLDVRDKYQRGAAGLFPGKERWASLDDREKLQQYIKEAKKGNKTLFIYDEVGKQVRWLQYALEEADIKDYYFMNKGAKGFYAQMMKEFGITTKRLQ